MSDSIFPFSKVITSWVSTGSKDTLYINCQNSMLICFFSFSWDTRLKIMCHTAAFFAHLSWKLIWAFLIEICPLSIVVIVGVVVNFSLFPLLLKNQWANFNQTSYKASLSTGDSSFIMNEGPYPFPRGDNNKIAKIPWRNF